MRPKLATSWPEIQAPVDDDTECGPCVTGQVLRALTEANLGPGHTHAAFGFIEPGSARCFAHARGFLRTSCGEYCGNTHKHKMAWDPQTQLHGTVTISCDDMAELLNAGPSGGMLTLSFYRPDWLRLDISRERRLEEVDYSLNTLAREGFQLETLDDPLEGFRMPIEWQPTERLALEQLFYPRWARLVEDWENRDETYDLNPDGRFD